MKTTRRRLGGPEWLILIGGSFFIVVLWLSAVWEADIRWLHFFQAWMYIAAIWLGLKKSKWGYFMGISAAGMWDYVNLFVNTFLTSGLRHLMEWIHTGHLARPDQLIAIPAWGSNLLVVAGCVWGYSRLREKRASDWGALLLTLAITMGFFAADMAIFQPRYLPIFRGMLHPHWPRL